MTEIKLTKRYPHSRTEDITDAYMRGWNDALDAVQNGKFHIADRKTESNSEKPNNCEVKNYCDDCLYNDTCDSKEFFYACTSKATISKMEQVDEPKTQTETQNSNLTFEKSDEPQTDDKHAVCTGCDYYDLPNTFHPCASCVDFSKYKPKIKDEPQTKCDHKCIQTEIGCEQTDCAWK